MEPKDSTMEEDQRARSPSMKKNGKEPKSLASRLASSASKLATNALGSTCTNGFVNTTFSNSLPGGKAALDSPLPLIAFQQFADVPIRTCDPSSSGNVESSTRFRSTPQDYRGEREFEAFIRSAYNQLPSTLALTSKELRDLHLSLSGSRSAHGHAITRLRMIVSHVTESAQSTESQQLDWSPLQDSLYDVTQCRATTGSRDAAQICLSGRVLDADLHPAIHDDSFTGHDQLKIARRNQQSSSRDIAQAGEVGDEDISTPGFHCPWAQCHQNLRNMMDLRKHSGAKPPYICAHEGCRARFGRHWEWKEHIMKPHHDLLNCRFCAARHCEG